MIIHVVQPGETLYSIADHFNTSIQKLILDNGITDPNTLVVGQTIVIVYPTQTYTVKRGDTLIGIASSHGITLNQLLRNNPFLSDRDDIYPGDNIVIRYGNSNKPKIVTNGYAYPFINRDVLKKTLPFLTYLMIFSYQALADGTLITIDDDELIQIAKNYGVAPIMTVSTISFDGLSNRDVANSIIYNEDVQGRQIHNILETLNKKGYHGLNISIHYLNIDNRFYYERYLTKLTTILNASGYEVTLTIIPRIFMGIDLTRYEILDYTGVTHAVNKVQLINYDWGHSYGPPMAVTSVYIARILLNHLIAQMAPKKINLGISFIAYDWQQPFVLGISKAQSLSSEAAINLAYQMGSTIYYEENSQSPYFEYTEDVSGMSYYHIVWFKDARSVNALLKLIPEYGFDGVGVWNIMNYFAQLWLIINIKYEIEKIDL